MRGRVPGLRAVPKCGNGNEPLDKAAAISALAAVLDLLGRPVSPRSGPGTALA